MRKRYLVTGCAGFIASKVAEMLLQSGCQVVGIDNLNDTYDPRLKDWRLAQLKAYSDFRFHQMDIVHRPALAAVFAGDAHAPENDELERRPYSAVLNLAARVGVRPSVENPWLYQQTNGEGTLNLLEMCRQHGIPKFVLASTCSLYGRDNAVPFREDADTSQPLSPYAASKKAAETLAYTYHHLHGLDVSVLRYFTVYGPAGRPDMSVFLFIRRIAEGEALVLFGDGRQSRDFTYIDDIARGTIAALKPLGYEIINLGGDHPVQMSTIIRRVGELVGQEPRIARRPPHAADVPATWADVGKAHELLDWSPRVAIEEGLCRTVTWYRQNREMILQLTMENP